MIIIPGTKNTIEDLKWLRQSGLEVKIVRHAKEGRAVFGVCGGYQMLGDIINDPEGVEGGGSIRGLGLLKTVTDFSGTKTTVRSSGKIGDIKGFYSLLSGIDVEGYEIHMGNSKIMEGQPLCLLDEKKDGCVRSNVAGSYIHGIFDSSRVVNAIVRTLAEHKGLSLEEISEFDFKKYKEIQYDKLADNVRNAVDMEQIYRIIGI